ncbi:MAG: DUF167 domain-containing protein [Gammaproteobacteria bacterium]|jgi:uncharacterized protein (TIGR00251 family)
MRIKIKVIPGSSVDCIGGWLGDRLKIKVSAAPDKGKANRSVQMLLEKALDLPKGSVLIIKGMTSEKKTIEIMTMDELEVYKRLAEHVMK